MPINVEIKAKCQDQDNVRRILKNNNAIFKGTDHQIDTYFVVPNGRLKLRQGSIENNLIHYNRPNQSGPKTSEVSLYACPESEDLHQVLSKALGVKVVVDKKREIYFINNVKFHLDNVEKLGTFVEIEAIDTDGSISAQRLHEQCTFYLNLFGVDEKDLITHSYSDLLKDGAA